MTIRKLGEVSSDFVALGKSREKYSNQITNYGNLCVFSIHKYQNCADGPQSKTGMSKRGLAAKVISEKITDYQRVLSFCP